MRWVILGLAAFIFLVSPHSVAAQSVDSATLTGRVTDPSGAVIPDAASSIRSTERNQTWSQPADDRGRFAFLYLLPGEYELTITAPGFDTRTTPLTLTVGQALDVPVMLAVTGISAQVDVVGDAPVIETRRTQAAESIRPDEIDALPLNGRNYLDLALLTPGVSRTVQRSTERFAETSAVPGTGISVAGQRNLSNSFIVDGLSANDDAAGLAGTYFAEDVIREFQVITSGGIAEFAGASGGIVSIVTRSGANAVGGRAYAFFRDDVLDARNPLASRKDPSRQAQYGMTASGPLRKDRTFWFANGERTDLDRTGVITIDAGAATAINRVLDASGYAGPRLGGSEFPTGYTTTNLFERVDHLIGNVNRLAGKYTFYDVGSENARNVGGLNAVSRGTRLDNRDQTGTVSLLSTVTPRTFNELRGQATRSRLGAPVNDLVGPAVNIGGTASFGTSTTSPTRRDLDVYEISDSVTTQRGDHLFKAGGSLVHERLNIVFPGALQGLYTFQSLALFQQGRYVNYQQAVGDEAQFQTNTNAGLFVQDEWRPRPALTVNAGLRYDVQRMDEVIHADLDNLSPRIGISFAPGSARTVVRASGGLYFDRLPLRAVSNALQRDGVKYRVALISFDQPGAPAFPNVLTGFPAGILTNITTIDPDIQNGVGRQLNLQVERQIGRRTSASITYLHLTGRGIIMSRNVNVPTLTAAQSAALGIPNLGRPDSRFGNNGQFQSLGQSDFNGLTLSARASAGRFGTLRTSYTWSKALDDAGNAFFSTPQDNFNVHDDYGRSDNDQRHRFVISGTSPMPGRVDLSYLFSYASAPPFNIVTGNDRNNDTTVNDRPAGVGRNTGVGFDAATLDLRIGRRFAVRGASSLELSLDVFNLFNRSNFLIPNNTFGTGLIPPATFGRPTAAADPRQLQLGIRWLF